MTRTTLESTTVQDLDNEDRVRVLGIIDEFRELGVNEDISLPQLVVVGDQSSGKSSLLEGLTGLTFPVASELCTRFATQIVLRRSPAGERSAKVSILPGPVANSDEIQKAAIHMGLPGVDDKNVEEMDKRFSDDILKIELCGPEHHHLSVVDVPGLFHKGPSFCKALTSFRLNRSDFHSAVMDGRNNLANQEVFRMARAADPQGKRTVGIITKCDALQPGDEQMNRSTQEIQDGVTLQQRNEREKKFFNAAPWNSLPKDRTGIQSLKKFLGKLLYNHIKGEFPALVSEIRDLVLKSREELDALGAPRQTTLQQRQFLSRIATKYQQTVVNSLKGDYDSEWSVDDWRKLRMHLHLQNEQFASDITRAGHNRPFCNVDDSADEEYGTPSSGQDHIYQWIRQRYRESRGAELPGTVNPTVLENLFRQQAAKWGPIARNHAATIDNLISNFNDQIWKDILIEDSIRYQMEARNAETARLARLKASEELEKLLADEMTGILQTVNHYFADTLAATRQDRVLQRLKKLGLQDGQEQLVDLGKITSAAHLSNEDQAVFDIHDILRAYYKVAIKRFNDNVVLQVVERCYLGESGPVKCVNPGYIGELSDEELSDLAAENYATSSARNETSQRLDRLERALKIAESVHL
nr:interferon-induced gtp-binding protein mx2 [Quercus suber]